MNHDFTVEQLRELGQDVERNVLARAVRWHLEDRVIVDGNKTVVFNKRLHLCLKRHTLSMPFCLKQNNGEKWD